ncbi:biotin transporter BioY [Janibacter alkaliphilus]|uniref:Biotin transporter n=1 Tax=Janibacter alkaliphilus TaxID=1069963 RepID=A0A852X0H4_9MICO|nr:biotin transporter BioY [Janibacter alkaliphilus]NYG35997.1 biotin transport system substrate-specific component [Janibacter alkaliphilus]
MTSTTSAPARTSAAVDLALVSAFAALAAVCSILPAINVSTFAPITLQTFGVLLAGAVLGARRGVLAILLWLALGAAGLPVFANGKSGLAVLAGPTSGYLVGFVVGVAIMGVVAEFLARRGQVSNPLALFAGGLLAVLVIHVLGIVGLHLRADLDWAAAATVDGAFWIGDLIKLAATAVVAAAVHRAFPWLLRRRAA